MAPISYMQIENLTKSYGDRLLFGDVTFGINQGDKIGIIAKNGTGKTTMLRIIAGLESPDSGSVTYRSGLKVAMVEQKPRFDRDNMSAVEACAPHDPEVAARMLSQLGISDPSAPTATMSGGQQKRVAIAAALLDEPDLLILDEPTNHLDIKVIEWLETRLKRSRMTLLLVTHDRYFLDRVCNKIIEIDHGGIFTYQGNFDEYLRRRTERINALTGELAKVRNTLRREQEWMSRQPQARAGKAKFRIDAFHELKRRSQADYTERTVSLDVKSSYIGSKIFVADGITKRYGDKLLVDGFTYDFARYDKVGIVGPNGVGKSTFIKMLQGLVQPDSGRFDVGETVRFGYYSQEGLAFDNSKRVIDVITDLAEEIVLEGGERHSPMNYLQRFLFSPKDQQKYVHTLSGGELARLHLAAVLMRSPNFLILDEPTNDLDIVTLGLLEEYLADFKGCAIIVSHDRFFLDTIVEHLFVFEGNGVIKDFPGNYSDYRAFIEQQQAAAAAPEAKARKEKPHRENAEKPRKLSFKEKKLMEALEQEISDLSQEKEQLEAIFAGSDPSADIDAASRRYTEVKAQLDEKEMQWLELSELG
ncbi:MAG: ABC-F family ATP-binding cassette domain-containing protein [Muribaculaceae bacterium]|nr:ABC-F family ATP-binding cassette domain-containing protein [Muribaculaceae bacterium]